MPTFRKFTLVFALAALTILGGCDTGPKLSWKTQNITGGLPALQFNLTDENGHAVQASNYAGKVRLLYFGYMHCPDVCPTTLETLHEALHDIGKQADAVRVLFVSVDPKRDTPAGLKAYTSAFGPRFIGLTGTQKQLEAVTSHYHVTYDYYPPDPSGNYAVQHSSAVFVFDRSGKARLLMQYQTGAAAMAHDLRQLVEEK